MSTTSTKRPSGISKSVWEKNTYNAYLDYIHVLDKQLTVEAYLERYSDLFTACGMVDNHAYYFLSMAVAISKDTTKNHSEVRHINPCYTLRAYFNGGWKSRETRSLDYQTPSAPDESTPKAKKAVSAADITKYIAAMSAEDKAALIATLMGSKAA